MFFFIPFFIFLVSIVAIIWLISRKFVYLKKLTPEAVDNSDANHGNFLFDLFPEIVSYFNKNSFAELKLNSLAQFEKFLRRLRLLSLRLDSLTNSLIHRVRK